MRYVRSGARRPCQVHGLVAGIILTLSVRAILPSPLADSATAGNRPISEGAGPSGKSKQETSGPVLVESPSRLEVAHAVMVTIELDLGAPVPGIAEALAGVERRYRPDDGTGRTFAILDAYGEPTPAGKLHMSMHVSAEKPGGAALVLRRTGEVLWQAQIVKGTNPPAGNFARQGLVMLIDNGAGQTLTVDGSKNPRSILEAQVKEMGVTVAEIWPEGTERQMTFLYSACGCPVKVLAMRVGEKTVRTSARPLIFPDDPAVVTVIRRIMRWE